MKEIDSEMKQYEAAIVDEHHRLDVFRTKGKNRKQMSFKDLNLPETLNYIKNNLGNIEEAYQIYSIKKE